MPCVRLGGRYAAGLLERLQPRPTACAQGGGTRQQGIAFHAFRKACGSVRLLRAGKDPRQVQRWLGHSQLTTTMNVYVHDLDDGLGVAPKQVVSSGPPWRLGVSEATSPRRT